MSSSAQLDKLIRALQVQPGVGTRSATRIAYHLLDRRRSDASELGHVLIEAMNNIRQCTCCRNYSDSDLCKICANQERHNTRSLCIVESPSDVEAIENSNNFFGLYFVLHGHLSPIDGIGAKELGLPLLDSLLATNKFDEIILATNPTIEGDATASFIASLAQRHNIKHISKIASGVPLGGDLDSVDQKTLASSFMNRRPFSQALIFHIKQACVFACLIA